MVGKIASFWKQPTVLASAILLLLSVHTRADAQAPQNDLSNMNIEDLMNVEVTSVSRHEQSLSQTAAAVFVISKEDILHSSATNIPDLLRMVPGVQVAQIDASSWAISIRGFNSRFGNKVLVMVDGRTVYVPSFGGVFYDTLDVPLEQIARIEVIRGPGGSVWGANAVNGVINVITKKAADTPGTTVVGGGGSSDRGLGLLQQGGKLGEVTDFRIFADYSTEGSQPSADVQPVEDGWHLLHGGFRVDSKISSRDSLSLQGDLYSGREGISTQFPNSVTQPAFQATHEEVDISGGYVQGSWDHRYSGRSNTTLMVSYQRYFRRDVLGETRGTLDVDFQNNLSLGDRHQFVWGFDYRYSSSQTDGTFAVSVIPADRDTNIYSGFVEDDIELIPDRLHFTIGTKLEYHDYTGVAAMPSARVAWTPSASSTYWAAVSRAVRAPSDLDVGMRVTDAVYPGQNGIPVVVINLGNPHYQNEDLLAYEVGYRKLLRKNFSVDLAGYYNRYNNLQTWEASTPFLENTPAPAHLVIPLIDQNMMHGQSHGLEVFAKWQLLPRWALSPGYAFELLQLHLDSNSNDTESIAYAGKGTPVHSAQLRSQVTLPRQFSWDTSINFVDRLVDPSVASYTRLDSGVTWQWKKSLALSLFGQNLLQDHHLEFQDLSRSINSSLAVRSVYAKVVWHFE